MVKKTKGSQPEAESAQVEETVDQAVAVVPANESQAVPEPIRIPSSSPTFGQRMGRFLGFLFRLFLALALLAVIGAGLYFGLPLLYERYILPVQENTAELQQLRSQQVQSEQAVADLQTRLIALETQQAAQAESLTLLDGRLGDAEEQIAAHTETLTGLEKMQAALESKNDETSAELKRQVDLLKAMELLSRARLYMYQSNYGLAEQDVQSARDLLVMIRPEAQGSFAEDLDAVILRLDMILSDLPSFPVAASSDLDIAWQILLGRAPQAHPTITTTQTPEISSTVTPQATVTPMAGP